MESEWRFGKWLYGLSDATEWFLPGLVARIAVLTDPPIVLIDRPNGLNQARFLELPGKDHPDTYAELAPAFKFTARFPYGFHVVPDHV